MCIMMIYDVFAWGGSKFRDPYELTIVICKKKQIMRPGSPCGAKREVRFPKHSGLGLIQKIWTTVCQFRATRIGYSSQQVRYRTIFLLIFATSFLIRTSSYLL